MIMASNCKKCGIPLIGGSFSPLGKDQLCEKHYAEKLGMTQEQFYESMRND